jgi:hypothetical protein
LFYRHHESSSVEKQQAGADNTSLKQTANKEEQSQVGMSGSRVVQLAGERAISTVNAL